MITLQSDAYPFIYIIPDLNNNKNSKVVYYDEHGHVVIQYENTKMFLFQAYKKFENIFYLEKVEKPNIQKFILHIYNEMKKLKKDYVIENMCWLESHGNPIYSNGKEPCFFNEANQIRRHRAVNFYIKIINNL